MEPVLTEVLETFGASRCILGSNFPPDGLVRSNGEIWSTLDSLVARLSAGEAADLRGATARRAYRIAPA